MCCNSLLIWSVVSLKILNSIRQFWISTGRLVTKCRSPSDFVPHNLRVSHSKYKFKTSKFKHWWQIIRATSHYGRRSISTNEITRNHEFGLLTPHTRGQSPKAVILHGNTFDPSFDQNNILSKEVWVGQE